jgi:hypothetical protein
MKTTKRYGRIIQVYCTSCKEWYDERNVEALNIEEGPQGEDLLTFKCPKGHTHKFGRYGR